MLSTGELRTAWNGYQFVLACKITGPSHYFCPVEGFQNPKPSVTYRNKKNPCRLSYFTESEMLCTRELNTARNGSRFVLACKITGPSHYFYPSYLAFVGLAD
jgi:hypothetical protein